MPRIGTFGIVCAINTSCIAALTLMQRRDSCTTPVVNTQCVGNDLPNQWPPAYTSSAAECAKICEANSACNSYTFNKGTDGYQGPTEDNGSKYMCWCKSSCTSPSVDVLATSGNCLKQTVGDGQAVGDPHLTNTRGERFDINKDGVMDFLRVPYESESQGDKVNFTILATVGDVTGTSDHCKELRYITSLLFRGAWFEGHPLRITLRQGGMTVLHKDTQMKPSSEWVQIAFLPIGSLQLHMPAENQIHIWVGGTHVHVSLHNEISRHWMDGDTSRFSYLNIFVRSLGSLGSKIGGLLGEDDHADVSGVPKGCPREMFLTTAPKARLFQASATM